MRATASGASRCASGRRRAGCTASVRFVNLASSNAAEISGPLERIRRALDDDDRDVHGRPCRKAFLEFGECRVIAATDIAVCRQSDRCEIRVLPRGPCFLKASSQQFGSPRRRPTVPDGIEKSVRVMRQVRAPRPAGSARTDTRVPGENRVVAAARQHRRSNTPRARQVVRPGPVRGWPCLRDATAPIMANQPVGFEAERIGEGEPVRHQCRQLACPDRLGVEKARRSEATQVGCIDPIPCGGELVPTSVHAEASSGQP